MGQDSVVPRIARRLALVFVFAPCAILSIGWHSRAVASDDHQRRIRTGAEAKVRFARIEARLRAHAQDLDSLVALFEASNFVDAGEFALFCGHLEDSAGLRTASFRSIGNETHYRFDTGAPRLLEQPDVEFDVLEPSRIIGEERPVIMLSKFASSHGAQRGYASFTVDMESLLLEDRSSLVQESLVVQNSLRNSIASYSFQGGKLLKGALPSGSPEAELYSKELAQFGDVHFVYCAWPRELGASASSRGLTLVALLGLGALLSLYVQHLVSTRNLIASEVRRRTDELSQFAYRTSHDLRAPLVSVAGLCRAAREDAEDGDTEELVENLERIESQVDRLDHLVCGILDLTRADLSEHEAEPLDLPELVDEVVQHVRASYPDSGVRLDSAVEVDAPLVLPRARVRQVLENLVSNGVKYADHGSGAPFVRIRARRTAEGLELVVEDNGLGIPEHSRARLFRMFERFHPEATDLGSGLGLSIVQRHVERLRGAITCESDETGTTFRVVLPAPLVAIRPAA